LGEKHLFACNGEFGERVEKEVPHKGHSRNIGALEPWIDESRDELVIPDIRERMTQDIENEGEGNEI